MGPPGADRTGSGRIYHGGNEIQQNKQLVCRIYKNINPRIAVRLYIETQEGGEYLRQRCEIRTCKMTWFAENKPYGLKW